MAAVRRISKAVANLGSEVVVLGDSMCVVLAISKGRASDFGLNVLIRKIAAYVLACDLRLRIRWIP